LHVDIAFHYATGPLAFWRRNTILSVLLRSRVAPLALTRRFVVSDAPIPGLLFPTRRRQSIRMEPMTPEVPVVAPVEAAPTPAPIKRSPGHRGTDIRDTVAEMTARANEIQFEAGSKMANALKNIVRAAIADTELSLESTRDVVDYFRRRALMSTEDAQGLLDEVAEYASKRKPVEPPPGKGTPGKPTAAKVEPLARLAEALSLPPTPILNPAKPTAGPPSISSPAPAPVKVAPPSPIPEATVVPLAETSVGKATPKVAAKPAEAPAAKAEAPKAAAAAKTAEKAPAVAAAEVKAAPAAKIATPAKAPAAKSAATPAKTAAKAPAKAPAKKK
jgi:hypothetical protein